MDEIKLYNLKRLCKRDGINTGAELGRGLGLKGRSAISTGNQLLKGKRKIVGKTSKDLCKLFNVSEEEFLLPVGFQPQEEDNTPVPDTSYLLKIIEEQNKRIEEQGKRIDEQGHRITEQGKRIDDAMAISKNNDTSQIAMWGRINSMQDVLDEYHAKMKLVAESGCLKALGK
jgi:hypothetical protein